MTYCLGIKVQEGVVLVSDSRTSAGSDAVSSYSKMRTYGIPGDRQLVICSSGNLATTQSVFTHIDNDIKKSEKVNLFTVTSLDEAATYIGKISQAEQAKVTGGGPLFESSFLIGGEVAGDNPQVMLIYAAGNHIKVGRQTPFLQIGESKYGKPILDRVLTNKTPLQRAALCALVSMDATMRSNVSVAPPIELNLYTAGSLQPGKYGKFLEDSEYLSELKSGWDTLVSSAFDQLPDINWLDAQSE